jgi:ribokinase
MTVTGRVVVVGSINADWIVEVPRLPAGGQTVVGDRIERRHGGKGANQAVAAALAGARVNMVGAVGNDQVAAGELAALAAAGVDHSRVLRLADAPTGVAMITVDRAGENQITVAGGANAALSADQVSDRLGSLQLDDRDVVLVSNELESDTVSAAIVAADRAGSRVVLNPAPARPLAAGSWARLSLLTPNEPEVQALAGLTEVVAAARSLAAETRGPVIVTRGAAGASIVGEDAVVHVPAPECAPVDTVGAGDVFNGVLAARLVAGDSIREATTQAVARASESTRWLGARPPQIGVPHD